MRREQCSRRFVHCSNLGRFQIETAPGWPLERVLDRLELEYGAQGQRLATDISFFVAQLV